MIDTPPAAAAPADPLLDVSLRPRLAARPLLLVGLVLAVVPYFLSVAETSLVYENGRIASASYRDPLAIGCGAVALALGVLALALSLRRPRVAATIIGAVALLGLGGHQVARGFGVFFEPVRENLGEQMQLSPSQAVIPAPIAPAAPAPAAEPQRLTSKRAFEIARRVFEQWHGDKLDGLLDEQGQRNAGVRAMVHRRHELFGDQLGDVVGPEWATVSDDGRIRGIVRFARGDARYEISLADGERVDDVNLGLPDALEAKLSAGATKVSADAACKKVIGWLFAGKLDRARPLLDARLIANLGDDFEPGFADFVKKAGPIKKIATRKQAPCDGAKGPRFCFEYAVTTSRDVVTAKLDVQMLVGRWQVQSFNLESANQ